MKRRPSRQCIGALREGASMAQLRKQAQAKRQYRKPAVRKHRKLADVAEGVNILVTGRIE
jgi:hypothetical protein